MPATAATASARAAPASRTAGATGYSSSLLASSSALIAEISASTPLTSASRCRQRRTASSWAAGTYSALPRPAGRGVKYAYGPCGSPFAHWQPGLAAPA